MRQALQIAAVLGAFGLIATTASAAPPVAQSALSAQHFAIQAEYRGPMLNVGYSAETRRMTACLASYPGLYDPRTDLVRVAPGVTRRCTL